MFLVGALWVVSADRPAQAQAPAFSPGDRSAIEGIVREYLLKNPEIVIEAIQVFQEKQRLAETENFRLASASRAKELFEDPTAPVSGNLGGDVSLVEFFDYRCPYCKQVYPVTRKLLEEDGNIRFVYKEYPILGPNSVYAAKAALASQSQGKYDAFHHVLMTERGKLTPKKILKLAVSVGMDRGRLVDEMKRRETEFMEIIERNRELARQIGITGTPAFVIGDTIIRGAVDLASLKRAVATVRSKNKETVK